MYLLHNNNIFYISHEKTLIVVNATLYIHHTVVNEKILENGTKELKCVKPKTGAVELIGDFNMLRIVMYDCDS